ncbi:MAG: ankyrin repeat domain-containing protein [Dehalococcoidia bacterium]|nr:ankyrin repeat domain-containing protein [Dehalococcoidia bacterium]
MSTEFIAAIKSGDLTAMSTLLARNPSELESCDENGIGAVLTAIYSGNEQVARWLIEQGATLDIFAAAAAGTLDRIQQLLSENPALADSYSADGWAPLHLAAHFGRKTVADALIAGGATVDARSTNDLGNTPLHAAIAGRQDAIAGLLLANDADIDAADRSGNTALHIAAHDDEPDIVKLLVIHGAEVNPRNAEGKTPSGLAAGLGHTRVVEMLYAYGGEE